MKNMMLPAIVLLAISAVNAGAVNNNRTDSLEQFAGVPGITAAVLKAAACSVKAPAAPEAAAGVSIPSLPVGERDLFGSWETVAGGLADSITFSEEEGKYIFRSYLHDRPLEFGSWRLEGEKLFINSIMGETQYVKVEVKGGTLTLHRADGNKETYSGYERRGQKPASHGFMEASGPGDRSNKSGSVTCNCSSAGSSYGPVSGRDYSDARWQCASVIRTQYCDMSRGGCYANNYLHLATLSECR